MGSWSTAPTAELGICVPVGELVPGDAEGMREVASRMRRIGTGAEQVRRLIARVEAAEWRGESATAFRARVEEMPAPYAGAADSFSLAAMALDQLAEAIERARDVARRALWRWEEGYHRSREWQAQRDAWTAASGLPEPPDADLGAWIQAEATSHLAFAREDVRAAEQRALEGVQRAAEMVPADDDWGSFTSGLRDGTFGVAKLGWGLTPLSGHAGETWRALGGAALDATRDPWGTATQALSDFADDPYYAIGAGLPSALLGGTGVARHLLPDVTVPASLPEVPGFRPVNGLQSPHKRLQDRHHRTLGTEPGAGRSWSDILASGDGRLADLWRQQAADKIVAHSYNKHAVVQQEFPWAKDPYELYRYIQDVITRPSESFTELAGRALFWDDARQVAVIVQDDPAWGSAFVPDEGKAYFDSQVDDARTKLAAQEGSHT